MIGAILKMGLSMASYGASAKLVRESTKWLGGRFRGQIGKFATRWANKEVVGKGAWTAVAKYTGDDFYNKAITTHKRMSDAVARKARAHTSKNTYKWLNRLKRVSHEEIHFMPANYLMYRVDKHSSVTPEEKEMTKSFTKYYMGAPMVSSMIFGAAMYGQKGRMKKIGRHFLKKLSPERSRKMYNQTNQAFQGILQAGQMAANYVSAASATRAKMTEHRSILSLMGKRNPADIFRIAPAMFRQELERTKGGMETMLDVQLRELKAFGEQEKFRLGEITTKLKEQGRTRSEITQVKKQFNKTTNETQRAVLETFKKEVDKPSKTMRFVNGMINQLKNSNVENRKMMRNVTRSERKLTGKDFGWLKQEEMIIGEGPGLYNIGNKKYDFGRVSLSHMKDSLIKFSERNWQSNKMVQLFGLKDIIQFQQSSHALSTSFRSTGEGTIFFPRSYIDEVYEDTPKAQAKKVLGIMMPKASEEDLDLFLKDRMNQYSKKGIKTQASTAVTLEAAHGGLRVKAGDHMIQLPGGRVKLLTTLNDAKSGTPNRVSFDLGGADDGNLMQFLKFTSDTSRTPVKLMRSFLGRFDKKVYNEMIQVGPVPAGKILDADKSLTFIQDIKRRLELGYSQDKSIFSSISNVFRKHNNPSYPTTFYSDMHVRSPEFSDNIFRSDVKLGGRSKDVEGTYKRIRDHSTEMMDDFYMRMVTSSKTTDEVVGIISGVTKGLKTGAQSTYKLNAAEYMITPDMNIQDAKTKTNSLIELLKSSKGINGKSYLGHDMRDIIRIGEMFHEGSENRVLDLLAVKGSGRKSFVKGRSRELNLMDAYNSTTMRVIMGMNESISRTAAGVTSGKFYDKGEMLDRFTSGLRSYAVGEKEISAFTASSHLSRVHHKLAQAYSSIGDNIEEVAIEGNINRLKDIMTSLTGTTDYDDVVGYYKSKFAYKPYTPSFFDSRERHGNAFENEIYLIPKTLSGTHISRRKVPFTGDIGTLDIAQGTMDAANITTMTMFHSFNRAASGFLGIGLNEYTTTTPGQYFKKMLTKRVLPGIGMALGYSVADRLADRYLDGTPLGEGLTVFGANILAGARVAAQGMMDVTGVTDVSKYLEDLMPGIISSPASGAVRGFGPVALGMALGSKRGGPRGALMGGMVGSAMGALLGGGPLGVFQSWDISKYRSEVIQELTGEKEVAIRKGRWWEICNISCTKVRTCSGIKNIENINVGDTIVTHTGVQTKVGAISCHNEELTYIIKGSPFSVEDIQCTPDHPIYNFSNGKLQWKTAKDISTDDCLAYPLPNRDIIYTYIHQYIDKSKPTIIKTDNGKTKYIRYQYNKNGLISWNGSKPVKVGQDGVLNLTYDIGLVFGHYLGDGNVFRSGEKNRGARGIEFAFGPNEYDKLIEVQNSMLRSFGLETNIIKDSHRNMFRLRYTNSILGEIFDGLFQGVKKTIPLWMYEVKYNAFYSGLLSGLMDSDGTISRRNIVFTNTNLGIIHLFWQSCAYLGVYAKIHDNNRKYTRKHGYKDVYNVYLRAKPTSIFISKVPSHKCKSITSSKFESESVIKGIVKKSGTTYLLFPIESINTRKGTETFYDIRVDHEDHSFLGLAVAYHNSSSPFEGTKPSYFRSHMYALTRARYKQTPSLKDSIFTEVMGAMAPDIYAMKNYYSRPYPVTAGLFSDIPVFSNMMHLLPGSEMVTGAGITMHGEEYSQASMLGHSADMGINTTQVARQFNESTGIYSNTMGSAGGFPEQEGIVQSFDNQLLMAPSPMNRSSTEYALGESISNVKDIVGLRGFLMGSAFTEMSGRSDFFDYAPELATPVDIAGIRRSYWDMELGGILGASEIIRRYIPHRRNQVQVFNPIRNCLTHDTPILLANNQCVPICEINRGDTIISNEGLRQVANVVNRPYNGEIIYPILSTSFYSNAGFTPEHLLLTVRTQSCHHHPKRDTVCHNGKGNSTTCTHCGYNDYNERRYKTHQHYQDYTAEWRKVEDLNIHDYLLYPIQYTDNSITEILPDTSQIVDGRSSRLPHIIELNYELGYLCGLYLSEGSASSRNYTTKFALHQDEEYTLAYEISSICKNILDIKTSIDRSHKGNGISVIAYSKSFNQWLSNLFGSRSSNKTIPGWMIRNAPQSFLIGILHGHFEGDGSIISKRPSSKTKSRNLARALYNIGLQIGLVQSIHYGKDGVYMLSWSISNGKRYDNIFRTDLGYKISSFVKSNVPVITRSTSNWFFFQDNKYIALRVQDTIKDVYNGNVYDIIILEDEHCFCVEGYIVHNSMPSWLPGKDYYVDAQTGDPFTRVTLGEVRLPGESYELTHDVDLTFPIEASMLGMDEESQLSWYLGKPDFMSYYNKANDAVETIREDIIGAAQEYGTLIKKSTSVYNPDYDVRASADAVIQTYTGEKAAVKIVPKGFAGESDINAFMIMSDIDKSLLFEVDPEMGGVTKRMIYKDMQRLSDDLSRSRKSAFAAYTQISSGDEEGAATNLANSYSWFNRYNILSDIAPYSKEYKEADAIVRQQMTAGRLNPTQIGEYYQKQEQLEEVKQAVPFQEYRFMNIGKSLTQYGKAKDEFYKNEYSFLERQVGGMWEKFSHLRTPLHTKLLHQADPLEEYERSSIYGKRIKMWDNPYEDFAKSYYYQMMGEEDPMQGALSWATGGMLLGGTPVAAAMGIAGFASAAANRITGNVNIPGRVEERREVMSQLDAIKYAKYQKLYMETGDEDYLQKANRTITGSQIDGMILDPKTVGSRLGYPERDFVEHIINNVTSANIHRVKEVLPGPAVATMYNMIGEPNVARGMLQSDRTSDNMGRRIPGFESSIYSPDVPLETPAIETMRQESIEEHDAGMGWYDQMATLVRSKRAGLYNEGDTLYPDNFESSVGIKDFTNSLSAKGRLRSMLSRLGSNVMIVEDGRDIVSLEIITGV